MILRQSDSLADQSPLLHDPQLRQLVTDACDRIQTELLRYAPALAREVADWMSHLSPSGKAPDYFLQPSAFPLLPLVWWSARSFTAEPQQEFVADVVYSTANMYYFIRLLDNVMDGHATVEPRILPAAAFFHTEFQGIYQRHFPARHPFWNIFRSAWFCGNDAVVHELHLDSISPDEFDHVTVAKLSGARIPVTAVAYYLGDDDRLQCWDEFVRALARWSQLEDDLFDWHHDLRHGKTSYFLTEAANASDCESIEEWIVSKGFAQGVERLQDELTSLRRLVPPLHSSDVVEYLDRRETMLASEKARIAAAFKTLLEIASITASPAATQR